MDDELRQTAEELGGQTGGADAPGGDEEAGGSGVAEGEAPPHETRHSRRRFLVLGGALVAGFVGLFALVRGLWGSDGDVTGGAAQSVENVFSSFPINSVERVPTRTWNDWTLKVDGLVDRPLTLDATAWKALSRIDETADFHCVEGWSVGDVKWGGVTPATILTEAKARPEGTHLVFHAFTGEYVDSLPVDMAKDPQTVLADTMDGVPLPAKHGGPLRLVVPKQLGYKSVKWVTRIEVTDKPVEGYWEQRGYPSNAPI